jgi:hypothetical protein
MGRSSFVLRVWGKVPIMIESLAGMQGAGGTRPPGPIARGALATETRRTRHKDVLWAGDAYIMARYCLPSDGVRSALEHVHQSH